MCVPLLLLFPAFSPLPYSLTLEKTFQGAIPNPDLSDAPNVFNRFHYALKVGLVGVRECDVTAY